jgi:hypothetical protein
VDAPDRVAAIALEAAAGAPCAGCLVVGDGAARWRTAFADLPGVVLAGPGHDHPRAGALARIAARRAAGGEAVDAHALLPVYVRRPDADAHWVERNRVVGGSP